MLKKIEKRPTNTCFPRLRHAMRSTTNHGFRRVTPAYKKKTKKNLTRITTLWMKVHERMCERVCGKVMNEWSIRSLPAQGSLRLVWKDMNETGYEKKCTGTPGRMWGERIRWGNTLKEEKFWKQKSWERTGSQGHGCSGHTSCLSARVRFRRYLFRTRKGFIIREDSYVKLCVTIFWKMILEKLRLWEEL